MTNNKIRDGIFSIIKTFFMGNIISGGGVITMVSFITKKDNYLRCYKQEEIRDELNNMQQDGLIILFKEDSTGAELIGLTEKGKNIIRQD
jgi:hypothetical protein